MFEIESKSPDEIIVSTKKTTIKVNIADAIIDANLPVGKISGPGEFEIGDATIRGIATESGRTIYDIEIGGVHTGILGNIEENLDDKQVSINYYISEVLFPKHLFSKIISIIFSPNPHISSKVMLEKSNFI